jgi:hypothetical protein
MADNYVLAGSKNPAVDWTSEVILERDDDGNVTKSVSAERPAQLTKDDLAAIENLGLKVEKVTAEEVKEAEQRAASVGADALAQAPVIGDSGVTQTAKAANENNQSGSDRKSQSDSKSK